MMEHSSRPAASERKVYVQRWYVLVLLSCFSAAQSGIWNIWGPIAASAEAVYSWNDGTIALISNWGPITTIISTVFVTWLMDVKGMKITMLISTLLIALGSGLRCIPADTVENKSILIHLGQILNGLPGPLAMSGPPLLSATWFPVRQRTTATAIGTISSGLGIALSFIVGPYLVQDLPGRVDSVSAVEKVDQNIDKMRLQIEFYMFVIFCSCSALFIMVVIYFPNGPPTPPSITAAVGRLDYINGIKSLLRNGKFWMLALIYGIPAGIYNCYVSVLEVLMKTKGITQEETGFIGFYSAVAGNVVSIFVALYADVFKKNMKMCITILYIFGSISFIIFTLSYEEWWISFSKDTVYWSQIMGAVCLLAGIPLIFELSCEVTYPVAEGVTVGIMTCLSNMAGLIFLLILMLPDIGTSWMNWCLTCSIVFCIPSLLLLTEKYSRPD